MLLLIDAGNTRVKWALVPAHARTPQALGQWSRSGSVEHSQVRQLADTWRADPIRRVLISNVAGAAMRDRLEQVLGATFGLQPVPLEWFASTTAMAGVRNHYRIPHQLGSDRFASAIAAHTLFPEQPLIVATCGTATTIDALTADGVFLGGMILPGLQLMAHTLANNTAQLPQVREPLSMNTPFADNTDAAILSGCIAAQAGAIERALALHTRQQAPGAAAVQCILSGGAATSIAPHLAVPCKKVDNLVLIGLHAVTLHQPSPC